MRKMYKVAIVALLIAAGQFQVADAALRKSTINDVLERIILVGYQAGLMENMMMGKVPEVIRNSEQMKAVYSLDLPTRDYFSSTVLGPVKDRMFELARKLMADLKGTGYLKADIEEMDIDQIERTLRELEFVEMSEEDLAAVRAELRPATGL